MNLTPWQRIKRRIGLLGGSYTHPDGTIELDTDAAAGVDPTVDSPEEQEAKLDRYWARQTARERKARKAIGAVLLGMSVYYLAAGLGLPTWDAIGIGAGAGIGALLLAV